VRATASLLSVAPVVSGIGGRT